VISIRITRAVIEICSRLLDCSDPDVFYILVIKHLFNFCTHHSRFGSFPNPDNRRQYMCVSFSNSTKPPRLQKNGLGLLLGVPCRETSGHPAVGLFDEVSVNKFLEEYETLSLSVAAPKRLQTADSRPYIFDNTKD